MRFGRAFVLISDILLHIPAKQWEIQNQSDPVSIDQEEKCQEGVNGCFGQDIGIETVAEVDWVDVVAVEASVSFSYRHEIEGTVAYHSRSLYMIVKKT